MKDLSQLKFGEITKMKTTADSFFFLQTAACYKISKSCLSFYLLSVLLLLLLLLLFVELEVKDKV